jgi:hypothetical protein
MPVKRRLSKQIDGRVTPSIVAAYQRALALRERAHLSEDDRDAAHEAEAAVERMLGGGIRRMWQISVFDVFEFQEPGDPDWERSASLRRRLDAALAEAKRQREPEAAA